MLALIEMKLFNLWMAVMELHLGKVLFGVCLNTNCFFLRVCEILVGDN